MNAWSAKSAAGGEEVPLQRGTNAAGVKRIDSRDANQTGSVGVSGIVGLWSVLIATRARGRASQESASVAGGRDVSFLVEVRVVAVGAS